MAKANGIEIASTSLGIDIGGTFTDFVLINDKGKMFFVKTLTTYPDPLKGIMNGLNELINNHKINISKIDKIVHGTTLITNAIIERKGVKTGLITTKGFEDVLEIGREMRYDIYDIFITMPTPLIEKKYRRGITERVDKLGDIIEPIVQDEIEKVVDDLVKNNVVSIAVCLLHSYANIKHEKLIGNYIKTKYPQITYSLSSEVMPEIREYERCSATAMNAYVQPITQDYLSKLKKELNELGFRGTINIMISSGRLTTIDGAIKTPIQLLESGPAGGTMAGVYFGKLINKKDLVAFDMGGTTAKASMIKNLKPEITNQFEAAREKRFKKGSGLPVRIPVIDMIEIGAGGGSIAHINHLGLLEVGPESAASKPGPACYGMGGENPTVTDADLILGYLNEDYFLGGTMKLNKEMAVKAMKIKIADPLKISVEEAAWGIHRMVNENMANAARVHIIEKGLDPRFFSMLAFGGAGPVHSFHVAKLMNTPQLIVPSGAGVLSALGFLVSPIASEEITSYITTLDKIDFKKLNGMIDSMKQKGTNFINKSIAKTDRKNIKHQVTIVADMRYEGQGHEINVTIPNKLLNEKDLNAITKNFNEEYLLRYGRKIEGIAIEAVTWRVLVSVPAKNIIPNQSVIAQQAKSFKGYRNVYWGTGYEKTPVYERYSLQIDKPIKGPCIIEEFESTTVVGKDSTVTIDKFKNIIIDMK